MAPARAGPHHRLKVPSAPSDIVASVISHDEATIEELKLRQARQERAERRELAEAETEAEAETHQRRADKASYLRQKLEEQQRAGRESE